MTAGARMEDDMKKKGVNSGRAQKNLVSMSSVGGGAASRLHSRSQRRAASEALLWRCSRATPSAQREPVSGCPIPGGRRSRPSTQKPRSVFARPVCCLDPTFKPRQSSVTPGPFDLSPLHRCAYHPVQLPRPGRRQPRHARLHRVASDQQRCAEPYLPVARRARGLQGVAQLRSSKTLVEMT